MRRAAADGGLRRLARSVGSCGIARDHCVWDRPKTLDGRGAFFGLQLSIGSSHSLIFSLIPVSLLHLLAAIHTKPTQRFRVGKSATQPTVFPLLSVCRIKNLSGRRWRPSARIPASLEITSQAASCTKLPWLELLRQRSTPLAAARRGPSQQANRCLCFPKDARERVLAKNG